MVIENSMKLARMTKLSELVIGFILLSVATSVPEFAISLSAILSNNVSISIGNLLGSNIANLGLVLGILAITRPMIVRGASFEKLLTILFLSSLIPLLLLGLSKASVVVGVLLILVFVFFSLYSVKEKITLKLVEKEPNNLLQTLKEFRFYKSLFLVFIGMGFVFLSSKFLVNSGSNIAKFLRIKESLIGATIIALGTSLPELSIALTSVKEGRSKMALGNVIGSCLTNLTFIMGIVLISSPFTIDMSIFSTLLSFVIATTIITWYLFTTGKKLDRKEGILLLFIYITFLIVSFGAYSAILGSFLKMV